MCSSSHTLNILHILPDLMLHNIILFYFLVNLCGGSVNNVFL